MSDLEIILIIGLPGSGKTEYAKEIGRREHAEGRRFRIFDDPKDIKELMAHPEFYDTIIFTDPAFCLSHVRDEAELRIRQMFPHVGNILKVFFENDPRQCTKNDNERVRSLKSTGLIKFLSDRYTIPDRITPKPVWSGNVA